MFTFVRSLVAPRATMITALLSLSLFACSGEKPTESSCRPEMLETDLHALSPLAGPAVDSSTGAVKPGTYVISTTYLKLRAEPAAQSKFGELMNGLQGALKQAKGLVASQLAMSQSCGTARTFTVWADQSSMYEFVTGSAHEAAVMAVAQVSRGGSIVTHFEGNESSATFAQAAQTLATYSGPTY